MAQIHGGFDYPKWATSHYFWGITPKYLELANDLLAGAYNSLVYPPGYPAFLAGAKLIFQENLQHIRLLQATIDSLSIFLCFALLRRANVPAIISLLGAFFYASYPMFAAGSTFLLAEFSSPFVYLLLIYLTIRTADSQSRLMGFCLGIVLSFGSLIRPDMLLFVLVSIVCLVFINGIKRSLFVIAFLAIGFALPIGVWGGHNKIQHGDWVFTSTSGGVGLWEGLGEIENDYGYVLSDVKTAEMLKARGLKWHSIEANRFLKAEYFRAWKEHPGFVVKVLADRWTKILSSKDVWLPPSAALTGLSLILAKLGVIFCIAAAFIYRRNKVAILIILTAPIYALLSIGMVHYEPRYVRYVHLGYAFSVLLIISCLIEKAGQYFKKAELRLAVVMLLLFLGVVATDIPSIREQSEIARATPGIFDKARREMMGDGTPFPSLKPIVAGVTAVSENGTLFVTTSAEPYAYQLQFSIDPKEHEGVHVTYSGDLLEGGFAIGLLAADGSRWIDLGIVTTKGRFSGSLGTAIRGGKLPTIVIANQNPSGVSRIVFSEMTVRCAQGSCVAPAVMPEGKIGSAGLQQYGEQIDSKSVNVSSADLGKTVYQAAIATFTKMSNLQVNGPPETQYSYLAQWEPYRVEFPWFSKQSSKYLYAEGELFEGGLTVGLLDASGHWYAQENIIVPGRFRVVIPVRSSGDYSPLVANNTGSGKLNHFEIRSIQWLSSSK